MAHNILPSPWVSFEILSDRIFFTPAFVSYTREVEKLGH